MPTTITPIDFDKSLALEQEMAAIRRSLPLFATWQQDLARHPTVASYLQDYLLRLEGMELRRQIDRLGTACRVLDVGVGSGQSSLYLASRGHLVTAIEPSLDLCQVLETTANLYHLSIEIYHCNGESIHKIDQSFDVVIFNSSLHHCDDPLAALKNSYHCLTAGGKILLINEPILQFYRTKQWFYHRLATHPAEMGHYGGNEHNYRYDEYVKMLKLAGFSTIRSQPHFSVCDYQKRVQRSQLKVSSPSIHSQSLMLIKRFYYYFVAQLCRDRVQPSFVLDLLKQLSLIPVTFAAVKAVKSEDV